MQAAEQARLGATAPAMQMAGGGLGAGGGTAGEQSLFPALLGLLQGLSRRQSGESTREKLLGDVYGSNYLNQVKG
jgi:hypothetical protein